MFVCSSTVLKPKAATNTNQIEVLENMSFFFIALQKLIALPAIYDKVGNYKCI